MSHGQFPGRSSHDKWTEKSQVEIKPLGDFVRQKMTVFRQFYLIIEHAHWQTKVGSDRLNMTCWIHVRCINPLCTQNRIRLQYISSRESCVLLVVPRLWKIEVSGSGSLILSVNFAREFYQRSTKISNLLILIRKQSNINNMRYKNRRSHREIKNIRSKVKGGQRGLGGT